MCELCVNTSRRDVLKGASALAALSALSAISLTACSGQKTALVADAKPLPKTAQPLPLRDIRLQPSAFKTAQDANTRYLFELEPDRFLHNFREFAGLKPKGAVYGGWESDTIAGHSLGHYMSALAHLYSQTGDERAKQRLIYIIDELTEVQNAQGDGYVAGFTRKRKDKTIVDGKEIFPEIRSGDIRSAGFDLNGCWVPLYNWHKLYAGLLDAHKHCGLDQAITVGVKLGGYIEWVFAPLSDAQVQKVLDCEHGGINESFAELYARTNDKRWLAMAEKLYHRKVLDPLADKKDQLANLHANTQIPKLIGLARIHELTGEVRKGTAPSFFWDVVTQHHSYVIGGNADREYFYEPDAIANHITEQTCEGCNSYNMLKLTRHLYSWNINGAYFDFYERNHLNHILAQIEPESGMVTYMMPLMSGAVREHSTPFDSFWCCTGTGMESNAKHGDSVFWESANTLFVNLYIPSKAKWQNGQAAFTLDTRYPNDGQITLNIDQAEKAFVLAMRIPGWAGDDWQLKVNGKPVEASQDKGYVYLEKRWKAGDKVTLDLPMKLRLEGTQGDDSVVAVLRGPLVMAADLGSVDDKFDGTAPALVGSDLLGAFKAQSSELEYKTDGIGRPGDMTFSPFYANHKRRSAVYFKRFDDAQWAKEEVAYAAEQERLKDLAARSVDVMHLGEMQAERDHKLESEISYPVVYRGRNGRDARTGGFFSFTFKTAPGPLKLQATYWGEERNRVFYILVDGQRIATQTLNFNKPGQFFDVEYDIPEHLTQGKDSIKVRFEPQKGNTAGPVFGVLLFKPKHQQTI
ncbi:glycoside hydrolase family 127 protein [Gallaecimonas mangrovi]|uniref:glycoside hydrolase family 127 protein n=1 Tax=Gallaecimonas mangrovi TaxID=2291597 RepID=UPI000E202AA5|nr:glycoside hydrolase family 127 protein [Gallaecimonas mangrovi]